MEYTIEETPVFPEKKPESVSKETAEWKRTYSRAGLSVVALYGTVAVGQTVSLVFIAIVSMTLFVFGMLPPVDMQRFADFGSGYLSEYFSRLTGTGVIALLLLVFLLTQAAAWGVGYVVMRLIVRKGSPIEKRSLSLGQFLVIALMCFGVWGVGALLGNLSSFFGVETQDLFNVETLGAEALPYLLYAVIGAPIVEELTFRKALLDRLHDTHEGYAAIVSGLLFGLMHGNHHQFFLAFFLGMLFAMVYQRTGRVIYTMLLHGMINFTATLPELLFLADVDISLYWNIAVGTLIVAGLIVLLIRRKDLLFQVAPTAVFDANRATYRNVGMRIVRIAALVLIGVQGTIMMLMGLLQTTVSPLANLIDAIPLALVFLTVFLLPVFTKRYEKIDLQPEAMDRTEEADV